MVRKGKKKKISLSLKACYVLSILGFVLASLFVYYFSFDSRVHVLKCSGNYYYTDKQIYELAGASTDTRLWLTPDFIMKKKITSQSLIKNVNITKEKNTLTFDIEEKTVIGYYIKDGKNYLLTMDNESIELDAKYLKMIVHFPLLSNFSDSQLKQIAKQFKKNKKLLTRDVIEKIAEMVPFETTYDDNMIKMTMQDGNLVYTSMDSLAMMANYQAMLSELHGQNVCLFLDAEHSAIDKVDCATVGTSRQTSEEENKEDSSKDSAQESTSDTTDQQEQTDQTTEETTDESEDSIYDQASDWVVDDSMFGMEYSATLGIYRDGSTGLYYTWNEETLSFDQVE